MNLLLVLAQAPAPAKDLVTGGVDFVNALQALAVAIGILAAIGLVVQLFRDSHGAWTMALGGILLAAVFLFFITNPAILDGPIRATVNRFW